MLYAHAAGQWLSSEVFKVNVFELLLFEVVAGQAGTCRSLTQAVDGSKEISPSLDHQIIDIGVVSDFISRDYDWRRDVGVNTATHSFQRKIRALFNIFAGFHQITGGQGFDGCVY
jgi:hypothetical protein